MRLFKNKVMKKMNRIQRICFYGLLCLLFFIIVMIFVSVNQLNQRSEKDVTPEALSNSVDQSHETVLLETEDAGQDYIDNTLFLGDSNTVRFMITEQTLSEDFIISWQDYETITESDRTYTLENNTIAVVGMGISGIDSLECEQTSLGTLTMVDAISYLQPARIIITMGTNDLDGGATSGSDFANQYKEQLEKIAQASSSTDIIVNAIPPVAKDTIYSSTCSNEQIESYNAAMRDVCEENGWFYLNSTETLADAEGYAKDGYTAADGIHLTNDGMNALFAYIRCHALNQEKSYTSSLNIEIYGPLYDMIQVNPLNQETVDPNIYSNAQNQTVTAEPEQTALPEHVGATIQNAQEIEPADNSLNSEEGESESNDVQLEEVEEETGEDMVGEEETTP